MAVANWRVMREHYVKLNRELAISKLNTRVPLSRREQFLINSYQPAAEGSTYGHGTVRDPGIFGSRRKATYAESRKGIQSQKYKEILQSLKYDLKMTPSSFKALVARTEKQLGRKIKFQKGSNEAKIISGRVPSRWERASEGRVQSQYDIMKDPETLNLLDSRIRGYTQSLKDPNEQKQLQADIAKEQFLANPGEGLKIYQEGEAKKAKMTEGITKLQKQNQTSEVKQPQPTIRQKTAQVLGKTANILDAVNKITPGNEIHGPQYTPDPADFRRATGQAFDDKRWKSLIASNQVFDTTKKFGDAGGYWINDNRGIPRFVKYKGG